MKINAKLHNIASLCVGFALVIWFVARVIPRPCRAMYPCQRVGAPLVAQLLFTVTAWWGSMASFWKAKQLLARSKPALGGGCLLMALILGLIYTTGHGVKSSTADAMLPNEPVGEAKGLNPGRVVWVRDPRACTWDGSSGYWWQATHTNQRVVDRMLAAAVERLADRKGPLAWEALFRHFNRTHDKGDVGYQAGEKVTIKVNLVSCLSKHGWVDADTYEQTYGKEYVNSSPQSIVALLRQLVDVAGVSPGDIAVGDPLSHFPNHYWEFCHTAFPDVHYLDWEGKLGRTAVAPSDRFIYWSDPGSTSSDTLPVSYAEAGYLINLACLKGHGLAGVTLCGKNHYGSLLRVPSEKGSYSLHDSLPAEPAAQGMGYYRAIVDFMGHEHIGQKTLLYVIDGLYGGNGWAAVPEKWHSKPFNGHWPASLFVSQDPVAIDSVGFDFLRSEWSDNPLLPGADDYLHEAAQAEDPPSGTFYDPNGGATGLQSLGAHEHWNNASEKKYSRNLGTGSGIELIPVRCKTGDRRI